MRSICLFIILSCISVVLPPLEGRLDREIGPYLVLNNPSDSGMFAVFNSVLGALNCYDSGQYSGLKIDLNSGRYLDPKRGDNWWEYFFEPIRLGNQAYPLKYIFTLSDYLNVLTASAYPQDKWRASELIQKYIHLKPHIQAEVDAFCKKHFEGHYVICVHHRGTDKITEWPLMPYEKTCGIIAEAISTLSPSEAASLIIYVATDEQAFLDYLLQQFPGIVVYNDFSRSDGAKPLHDYDGHFYSSNYLMGKEALLDCLLLSKGNLLIRPGTSCLSFVATRFNPRMAVIDVIMN